MEGICRENGQENYPFEGMPTTTCDENATQERPGCVPTLEYGNDQKTSQVVKMLAPPGHCLRR